MNFLQASGQSSEFSAYADTLIPVIVSYWRGQHPDYSEICWRQMEKDMAGVMLANSTQMMGHAAEAYARHFTDSELLEIGAFLRSDVGKKYRHATIELMHNASSEPGAAKTLVEGMAALVRNGDSSTMPDAVEKILPAMKDYLTDAEIARIRAFYGSGVGRKYAEMGIVMAKETMDASMGQLARDAAKVGQKSRDSGVCS